MLLTREMLCAIDGKKFTGTVSFVRGCMEKSIQGIVHRKPKMTGTLRKNGARKNL